MSRLDVPPAPPVIRAPPTGWLGVAAGVLGVVGLVRPWYHPRLSVPYNGVTNLGATYHSWTGYRIFVLAPILLVIWGFFWVQALRGEHNARVRSGPDPVRAPGVQSIAVGVVSLLATVLSVFVMKYHYQDWDAVAQLVKARGSRLEKNPQIGLYVVVLGAVLLIAAGVSVLIRTAPAPGPSTAERPAALDDESADHESGPVSG